MRLYGACALAFLLLSFAGCGGQREAVSSAAGPDLVKQLAELQALPAPDNVPDDVWRQLKDALAAYLNQHHSDGRIAAAAATGDSSRPQLSFDSGTNTLSWRFSTSGDYDQNGEVNISDLTPLGANFGASSGGGAFPYATALSVIDGDGNGEINISDITPIGANFGVRTTSYNVYTTLDAGDYPPGNGAASTLAALGTVALDAATGSSGTDRLQFSFTLPEPGDPAAIYWVRPSDGAAEGTPSHMVGPGAPIQSSIEVYQLDFEIDEGPVVENSDWGMVDVTFTGAAGTLFFSMTFNDEEVLTNIPLNSIEGIGVEQTLTMPFGLGVAPGEELTTAEVGYTLESAPKSAAELRRSVSGTIAPLTVQFRKKWLKNGEMVPGPSFKELGRQVELDTSYLTPVWHTGFKNVDIGVNEQTAGAVSMSLTFLRDTHGLEIGEEFGKPIDIATMKEACFALHDGPGGKYLGSALNWPTYKDEYMRTHQYPIVTTQTRDLRAAIKALEQGCDVEMVTKAQPPHGQEVYAIKGMQLMEGGGCWIAYADDLEPGLPGGLITSMAYLGVNTLAAEGYDQPGLLSFWGEDECDFVIECPTAAGHWQGWSLYKFGSLAASAAMLPDGSVAVAFREPVSNKLKLGIVSPLGLPGPAVDLLPEGSEGFSGPLLELKVKGDSFYVYYGIGLEEHKLNLIKGFFVGGEAVFGQPVTIDSDEVLFFDAVDAVSVGDVEGVTYQKGAGIYTTTATTPSAEEFTAPKQIDSFGAKPQLLQDEDEDALLVWIDSGRDQDCREVQLCRRRFRPRFARH